MRKAADSSIAIAALLADHPAHEAAADALANCKTTIAHAAFETYSVLTRLPAPHRVDARTAAAVLAKRLTTTYVTLDANSCTTASSTLAAAGVSGGATYDGLIALTALQTTSDSSPATNAPSAPTAHSTSPTNCCSKTTTAPHGAPACGPLQRYC